MRHLALTSIVTLSMVGCVQPSPIVGPSEEVAAQNRAAVYNRGMADIEALKVRWDDTTANSVQRCITAQFEMASGLRTIGYLGDEALQRYTRLAFAYADTCLKLGKLDRSDSTYRGVIENLIGAAYGGYRDRARVGLDDVRAARTAANMH